MFLKTLAEVQIRGSAVGGVKNLSGIFLFCLSDQISF